MVDLATVSQINTLISEYRATQDAIEALDAGGRIDEMTLGGVTVSTVDWDYPPTMVTAIKGLLQARLNSVQQYLSQLGFTGSAQRPEKPEEPEPEEPEPAQAAAPAARTPAAAAAIAAARQPPPPVPPAATRTVGRGASRQR